MIYFTFISRLLLYLIFLTIPIFIWLIILIPFFVGLLIILVFISCQFLNCNRQILDISRLHKFSIACFNLFAKYLNPRILLFQNSLILLECRFYLQHLCVVSPNSHILSGNIWQPRIIQGASSKFQI